MNPSVPKNIEVAIANHSNAEKLARIEPVTFPFDDFEELVERASACAAESDSGQITEIGQPQVNRQSARRYIGIAGGQILTLNLFVYQPVSEQYYPSVLANWHLVDLNCLEGKTVLQEYLSSRHLEGDKGQKLLGLLGESVLAYAQAGR